MLIEAVEHMHQLHVSHLDIKLDNILIDSSFHLKLSDFGHSTRKSKENHKYGTLEYVAPEVIEGADYYCQDADVFSCGVVLFALVFKAYPFDRTDTNHTHMKVFTQTPSKFLESFPPISP